MNTTSAASVTTATIAHWEGSLRLAAFCVSDETKLPDKTAQIKIKYDPAQMCLFVCVRVYVSMCLPIALVCSSVESVAQAITSLGGATARQSLIERLRPEEFEKVDRPGQARTARRLSRADHLSHI